MHRLFYDLFWFSWTCSLMTCSLKPPITVIVNLHDVVNFHDIFVILRPINNPNLSMPFMRLMADDLIKCVVLT